MRLLVLAGIMQIRYELFGKEPHEFFPGIQNGNCWLGVGIFCCLFFCSENWLIFFWVWGWGLKMCVCSQQMCFSFMSIFLEEVFPQESSPLRSQAYALLTSAVKPSVKYRVFGSPRTFGW